MENENLINMMSAAAESRPHDFAQSFTSELSDRLQAAVEDQRAAVVSNMFGINNDSGGEDTDG